MRGLIWWWMTVLSAGSRLFMFSEVGIPYFKTHSSTINHIKRDTCMRTPAFIFMFVVLLNVVFIKSAFHERVYFVLFLFGPQVLHDITGAFCWAWAQKRARTQENKTKQEKGWQRNQHFLFYHYTKETSENVLLLLLHKTLHVLNNNNNN